MRGTVWDHRGGTRDYDWDLVCLPLCVCVCVCVCVCKYLDVLHAVPQLDQELLGFGGSVWQAVERLRQLTLWRAQREDVRDAVHSNNSTNSFTYIYVYLTVLQVRGDWKKNQFQNLKRKTDCIGNEIWVRCFVRTLWNRDIFIYLTVNLSHDCERSCLLQAAHGQQRNRRLEMEQ